MKAEERRQIIAQTLTADKAISATALAGKFSVSRQIIVGDIALLRAAGMDIVATPRGYKLGESSACCGRWRQSTRRSRWSRSC